MTAQPPWRHLHEPGETADALVDFVVERGSSRYDEVVTQLEHALQCGSLAIDAGAPQGVVLAAFFHDIGHLLLNEHDDQSDFLGRDLRHERVGARFLANWFGDDVVVPVLLHVPAKRFLCATDSTYAGRLSDASVRSLAVQGGPMAAEEVAAFAAVTQHDSGVALRRWDDDAKVEAAPTQPIDVFRSMTKDYLSARCGAPQ